MPQASGAPGAPGSAGSDPAASGNEPAIMSVSVLAGLIAGALERVERPLRVIGEVSGFRERTHWYFDLKDGDAVVNCVMFASAARKAGFRLENGQSVVVTGRLEFYAKGGKVSLLCDRVEPVGAGALELAFRRLVAEIRALGWFDPARKRPLPAFPRRIAIVTSRTGAALQDVLDTARRRCPAVDLAIVDVRVQGDRAAPEIAAAIDWLGIHHARLGLDALLITRGGGSAEDLWAFNERTVARAIVECPIPVVAAIGHETDTTIAELVADERCATPTQAAMRLIPDRVALGEQLDALSSGLQAAVERSRTLGQRRAEDARRQLSSTARLAVAQARSRLERLAARLEQQRPAAAQARRESRLSEAERRLSVALRGRIRAINLGRLDRGLVDAMQRRLGREREAAASLERTLAAVSPLRVLARGYSVTTRADGRVVRQPADVTPGELIQTRTAEGSIRSTVEGQAGPDRATEAVRPTHPRRAQPRASVEPGAGQPGLFG